MSEPRQTRIPAEPRPKVGILAALILGLAFVGGAVLIGTLPHNQNSPSATAGNAATPPPTQGPILGLKTATYSCGGLAITPPLPTASAAPSGVETVLRGIEQRLPAILPATGWILVASSGGEVLYVAANTRTPAPYAFVLVSSSSSGGGWTATSYGDCEPATPPTAPHSDLRAVSWDIAQPPTLATTALKLKFQSNLCGDIFVGQTVWYDSFGVTITFWARHDPTGPQPSCLSATVMSPFTLTLAEPVGRRQILSGPASAGRVVAVAPKS
jgi:hypothetical protein